MSLHPRAEMYRIMSPVGDPSGAKHAASLVLIATILAAVLEAMFATVPGIARSYGEIFRIIQVGAFGVFTLEYVARLWIVPVGSPTNPHKALRTYVLSFLGFVDFVVIAPFWFGLVVRLPDSVLMMAALLSLAKLARFVPGFGLFISVFRNEARSLLAALILLIVLLILASGLVFVLEFPAQPQVFASIPHTLWWGIVTIASVGYGDMTPVTPLGRGLAGIFMLLGIAVFAVPAGILATGFARELRKRDFMVSWKTVMQMPLFSGLDANVIGEISRLLTTQIIPPNTIIVRKGDPAQSMFFVMEGDVQVEVSPRPIRLTAGHYFGEIALLKDMERTASVISITEVRLLVLDVKDFRRLLENHPGLRETIVRVAESRLTAGC
jgi:voltage-gated potassium channel